MEHEKEWIQKESSKQQWGLKKVMVHQETINVLQEFLITKTTLHSDIRFQKTALPHRQF